VIAGDIIAGRFEIERAMAAGGMGRIYRARDRQTGDVVALKYLTQDSESALDRFLHEAAVLAEIQHPGVVRYIAHGRTADGMAYLVMEWLEGMDLSRYLKRRTSQIPGALLPAPEPAPETMDREHRASSSAGPGSGGSARAQRQLPVGQIMTLGRRLASAVAELHRRGLVHRDLKPSNIFLPGTAIEHLKVVDLGAVWRERGQGPAQDGDMLVGTPHYMSPEQARMNGEITPATDVWAIGCVLYVCLTGLKPFPGGDALATLTRIVVDEPVPVSALRPDAPPALTALVAACMRKDPAERPRDAAAVAAVLERLGPDGAAPVATPGPRALSTEQLRITTTERRVTCMALASASQHRAPAGPALDQLVDDLRRAVAPSGCQLAPLADGTILVTVPGTHLPTDHATRAARAALALCALEPALRVVLATARTEDDHPVGQAVSEAARRLRTAGPGQIYLDELTASLLDARFHIERDPGGQGAVLGAEREQARARTLLGKATPLVGRARELGALLSAFERCAIQRRAQAVLVTAPAGMGKSRLRDELTRTLAARGSAIELLLARGDMASAGSPFLLLAPALRRAVGIIDGEPLASARDKLRARVAEAIPLGRRERVTVFLGELAGIPFPVEGNDALLAARKDPMLMGQLMQSAFEEWLRGLATRRPVLLVLEDLHWGDLPSVRFVDAALRALPDRPLLVLALARPEVHGVFPRLWEGRDVEHIALAALPREAAQALVQAILGETAPGALVDTLVRRADGNAFFLEELIRSAAERGHSRHLPESVLAMVQARLDALGPEAKRILRAASVFGEVFWYGGVAALSGEDHVFHLHEWLDDLVAREVIVRQAASRMPGEVEYRFRHALLHDAAYAMLTAEDRALGHVLAGVWLEQAGERDARIVAEHFLRSREPGRAVPHLVRAAEQAMEGSDLEAVRQLAARGVEAGAEHAVRGRLRALQAAASYWLGDHASSRDHGAEAARLLEPGTGPWFVAAGTAMVSSARLGDFDTVDDLAGAALHAPCAADAAAEQLVALCRISFQLLFNGHDARAEPILDRIMLLAADAGYLDPLTRAQVHHLQSLRCALAGDVPGTLRQLTVAVAEFERAGDLRNVALERTSLALWWGELGYVGHAIRLCEDNLRLCEQQNAQQAVTFAKVNLGPLLGRSPAGRERARRVLAEAVDECRAVGNTRLEGWAHVHLAEVAHALADREAEAQAATRAVSLLEASPSLQAWALAVHGRAELARGHAAEARALARRAVELARRVRLTLGRSLPHLVLAQALDATGEPEGARAALRVAADELARRLSYLDRPSWRARFLARPEHGAIVALARAWLGRDLAGEAGSAAASDLDASSAVEEFGRSDTVVDTAAMPAGRE
jgi:serine/threonine protein kinase/tetratricopeptide (TPR) repeat protein